MSVAILIKVNNQLYGRSLVFPSTMEDDESYDYENIDPHDAGDELASLLIDLKITGKMNATQACTISWWAVKAGAVGAVEKLAYRPNAQSGKFSAHFDRVTRAPDDDTCVYNVSTPRYNRCTGTRDTFKSPTLVAHEALAEEIADNPDLPDKLHAAIASNELPQRYFQHPVVTSAPPDTIVYPIAVYMDGVHIKRRDNCLGFWVYNMLTHTRHLLAAIRKCTFCMCGCKGWCTLFSIFQALYWSLDRLSAGEWPLCRHDGSAFISPEDDMRIALAGAQFGFRCAVVYVKGDWAEYAHTIGLPNWMSRISPCPMCHVPFCDLLNIAGMTPLRLPYDGKEHADYVNACNVCEVVVTIASHAELRIVRSHLRFDRRQSGGHGRCITTTLPQFGLCVGDRLEPTPQLADVSNFDLLVTFPVNVIFWRRSLNTITLHRNPFFSEELGVSFDTLTCDALHVLSLGVYGFFIAFVFHLLFDVDAWGTGIRAGADGRRAQSCIALRAELWEFYRTEKARGVVHTELDDLIPTMIGPRRDPDMHTQGAETNSLLMFLPVLLDRHQHKLPNGHLVRVACDCLVRIRTLIRMHMHNFPGNCIQEFYNATKRFLLVNREIGGPEKPKHHMLCHMAVHIHDHGAPSAYATWVDEDQNGKLKRLGINAHTSVWEHRVLLDWRAHYGSGGRVRSVRPRR